MMAFMSGVNGMIGGGTAVVKSSGIGQRLTKRQKEEQMIWGASSYSIIVRWHWRHWGGMMQRWQRM